MLEKDIKKVLLPQTFLEVHHFVFISANLTKNETTDKRTFVGVFSTTIFFNDNETHYISFGSKDPFLTVTVDPTTSGWFTKSTN